MASNPTAQDVEVWHERLLSGMDTVIEWMLKAFMILAEVVLLVGIGYAGYKMAQHGNTNPGVDTVWIVSQIIALDLSAPGLFVMSREARERGDTSRASWATGIAVTLIVLSILSMCEGAIQVYFPLAKGWGMDALSLFLLISRCVGAVCYSVFRRLHKSGRHAPPARVVDALQEQIDTQRNELQRLHEQHTHAIQQRDTQHEQRLQTTITEITASHEARTQELIGQLLAQVNEQAQERIEAMQQTITRVAIEQVTTTVQQALPPVVAAPRLSSMPIMQITEGAIDQGDTKERIRAIYHTDRSLSSRKISAMLGGKPSHPTVQKYLDQIIIEESEA